MMQQEETAEKLAVFIKDNTEEDICHKTYHICFHRSLTLRGRNPASKKA
jgi:hypothetical protein